MCENIEMSGFRLRRESYGLSLILDESRIDESVEFMIQRNLKALEINHMFHYSSHNLEHLVSFPFVKHLNIVAPITDYEGLYYLKKLQTLYLQTGATNAVVFSGFRQLKECMFCWSRMTGETILDCQKLKSLHIDRFPYSNLKILGKLPYLSKLTLSNSTHVLELTGISSLRRLNSLDLSYLPSLRQIRDIKHLDQLRSLEVYTCKGIEDLESIGNIRNLESLMLNNVGSIPSIEFIRDLRGLRRFHFIESTNVRSGDLRPIADAESLRDVSFQNRKHYTHKREDFGFPLGE